MKSQSNAGNPAKTPAPSNAAPVEQTQALAGINPDLLKDMAESTETGFEGATGADFSIPFLALLQKMSPQVDEADDAYVPGAKIGQFYNSATGKLYDTVQVIPCFHKRSMVEWKADRGGFVMQHEPGVELGLPQNEKGQFLLPSGNILIDTRYFMCLQLDEDGTTRPIIVAMASTQIKVAKTWMSRMQAIMLDGPHGKFNPPMFSHLWELSSVDKKNEHGSWKLYDVKNLGPVPDMSLFKAAKENRKVFATTVIQPPLLAAHEESAAGDKM